MSSEIQSINSKIIRSSTALIALITGYDNSYITLVLRGKRKNEKIEQVAKDIYDLQEILIQKYKSNKKA